MARPETLAPPRRFYETVTVGEEPGGFQILLDGRRARTPAGGWLALPTRALADLVAAEWAAQGATLDPTAMIATRLAYGAIDGDERAREAHAAAVERYGATDLLCYFAETPRSLVQRQERVWAPLLDWVGSSRGLEFRRGAGIVHQPQPAATLERLAALAADVEPFALPGLAAAAALFGSAILALALWDGRLDAADALDAARLDETFQQEQWGVDVEDAARVAALAREAGVLERWFRALAPGESGD